MVDNEQLTRIGYARVSTVDKQSLGLELQIEALKAAGCSPVFYEEISGSKDNRKEMLKAIATAKRIRASGTPVSFYIYKLDRLGRHTSRAIQIVEELNRSQITVISLKEGFDTATAAGVLQYQLLASFAEYELNSIRQRTKDGLAQAKRNGRRLGRPGVNENLKQAVITTYTNSKITVEVIAQKYHLGISTVYKIIHDAGVKRRKAR